MGGVGEGVYTTITKLRYTRHSNVRNPTNEYTPSCFDVVRLRRLVLACDFIKHGHSTLEFDLSSMYMFTSISPSIWPD